MLLNEYRLNPEVFIDKEQFKKICGKNILGQTIVCLTCLDFVV